MLQVHNHTPFKTERGVLLDPAGGQVWVVAIKASYGFDDSGRVSLLDAQEPVCLGPEYFGDPGKSSLKREGELVVEHPGTDVIVNASAYAPRGRAVPSLDVAVEVAGLRRVLAVFGHRVWRVGLRGARKSAPEPFVKMPIVYERAFGGHATHGVPASEARNPVGVGFAQDETHTHERPLPNVEDHAQPIESWSDRPAPAGLGAIAPDWSPRRELAGTFDDTWKRTQAPLWPRDYNPLFHRSASPGLWSAQPLKGGERFTATGLSPSGYIELRLPREAFIVETRLAGQRYTHPPQLDRVLLELDERRIVMVWSARLACATRAREVEYTSVELKARLA